MRGAPQPAKVQGGGSELLADQLDRAATPSLRVSFAVDGEAGFALIIIPEINNSPNSIYTNIGKA